MITEEKIASFATELSGIKDEKLKKFVENILDGTGDWFYHDPASTSGKYHPKYALGDGGLMRHTKAVVYWVRELWRTELFDVTERQCELLSAAAILHDIRKHTATGSYIANHARASYNLVMEVQEKNPDLLSKSEAQYIADAVSTHMGVWGVKDGERKPTTDAEKLLHLADYCASRKEIIMEFPEAPKKNILEVKIPSVKIVGAPVVEEKKEEVKEEVKPADDVFVFHFGKYKGMTIEEVYKINADYLTWITNQTDFFDKTAQEKIRNYVNSKK
jgi:HD superfamily phosphohydrolase YqeK